MLGKSPAMPDAGGANSGYLVTEDGYSLLLDCGSGVFSRLRLYRDPTQVDAVLITHLHADHSLDLFPFSHSLAFNRRDSGHHPLLCAPNGARDAFTRLCDIFQAPDQITQAFRLEEYDAVEPLQVGPFTVTLAEVPHYIPTWACDLAVADGRRFTFGADCAPNDAIVELARGTDLLMLEATETFAPEVAPPNRGHMSAREAGGLGRRAGAKRLVLTHYSDELDASQVRAEGQAGYGAAVELAVADATYVI